MTQHPNFLFFFPYDGVNCHICLNLSMIVMGIRQLVTAKKDSKLGTK